MLILENPYVSNTLLKYAVDKAVPVLRNAKSEQLLAEGWNLNLLDDSAFKSEYEKCNKIYTMSENALGWINEHLSSNDLLSRIGILKDKSKFREICSNIYPDFFFKEVDANDLYSLSENELRFPLVLKPSVGFLSAGVYIIQNHTDWKKALNDIKQNFESVQNQFPDFVIGKGKFLIEEYIYGDEFAVDAYFDADAKPVIINIFHHRFASLSDASDRLYCISKSLYDKYLLEFTSFLNKINSLLDLRNFPMHIEFRYDGTKAIPIEINPLRFAGFCLNEIQTYISGVHPVQAFIENIHFDYEKMWQGREDLTYSFLVLERPANISENKTLDESKIRGFFSDILEIRTIKNAAVGVLATMFVRTDKQHIEELDGALTLNMKQFVK